MNAQDGNNYFEFWVFRSSNAKLRVYIVFNSDDLAADLTKKG